MKKLISSIVFLISITATHFSFAQSNQEKAMEKGRAAMALENEGKMDDAILLLEEAKRLDPENINYPYELAYAQYALKDYKKAAKILDGLLKHKDVNDRVFQLLGNSYDNIGQTEKAMEAYENGLKKFPNSGIIYLEMGNMKLANKEYNNALGYYEKGIKVNPEFPSNYYWASKIYCGSSEEVWGMIYGEIFLNMERSTKRTADISKVLYDTYKSEIKYTSDTSFSVSFSQSSTISIDDIKDPGKMKLPYGIGVYEPTLMLSMFMEKGVDMNSLDRMRQGFVKMYFEKEFNKTYPNLLFNYQKSILDAGHMEAYNHWILMKGDEEAFAKWQSGNKVKWEMFLQWFKENKLKVDGNNKFHRSQY